MNFFEKHFHVCYFKYCWWLLLLHIIHNSSFCWGKCTHDCVVWKTITMRLKTTAAATAENKWKHKFWTFFCNNLIAICSMAYAGNVFVCPKWSAWELHFSDGEPLSGNRCRCVLAILSFIDFRDKEWLNRDFPMVYYSELSGKMGRGDRHRQQVNDVHLPVVYPRSTLWRSALEPFERAPRATIKQLHHAIMNATKHWEFIWNSAVWWVSKLSITIETDS